MGNDRISDFGEAREIGNVEQTMTMTTGVGTPFYMAPELLQGERQYTKAVDVYSYGVMSAQVFSGSLKYDDISFDNIYCLFSSLFSSLFHGVSSSLLFSWFCCFVHHSICDEGV